MALLIDYVAPSPAFCGGESGCAAVRQSGLGYVHLPGVGRFPYLPVFGVLTFSLLIAGSLLPSPRLRSRLCEPLAYGAALGGLALVIVQAVVIGEFCYLCMIVDGASMIAAVAAFRLRGARWEESASFEHSRQSVVDADMLLSEGQSVKGVWRDDSRVYSPPNPLVQPEMSMRFRLRRLGWAFLAILAVLAPVGYSALVVTDPVPGPITELYQPGKINVVEFFDYQCPHCQTLAPRLEAALAPYGDRVNFVRQHVPLKNHALAREASRYTLCADEQGQGETMAHAIFRLPALDEALLAAEAKKLGLDETKLAACLASERPNQVIEAMTKRIERAGFVGLPTTYVGAQRILGAQEREVYEAALAEAASGVKPFSVNPWLYWFSVLCLALGIVLWAQPRSSASVGTER